MHRFEDLIGSNLISLLGAESGEQRLLVALSGGADSVALLRALAALVSAAPEKPYKIFACHINHGLRGQDADDDQAFCEKLCRELGVTLEVKQLNLSSKKSPNKNSENALRGLRYEALAAVALNLSISYVVTAHNLSDQVETMLFRLCRGTALPGLGGIKAERLLAPNLHLLRPLLALSRSEIESYLGDISQSWCTDKSNADSKYTRNFLRNQIVPQLTERFPALSQSFEHLRQNVILENDLLETLAKEQLENLRLSRPNSLSLSAWQNLHAALQARVFVAFMRECGVEASFERLQRLRHLVALKESEKGHKLAKRYSLGDGVDLLLEDDCLILAPELAGNTKSHKGENNELAQCRQRMTPITVQLPVSGKTSRLTLLPWLDKALQVEELVGAGDKFVFPHRQAHHCLVDLSSAVGPLSFRLRQDGDRIHPLGMGQSVRLKQYLHANKDEAQGHLLNIVDEKLAQRLTPVLVDQEEVLWVPGYGLSQKVKVSQRPTHMLSLIDLASDSPKNDTAVC